MWASAWVVLAQWPAPSGAGAFRVSVSAAPLTSSAKRPLNEACAMCALALRSSFVFRTFRVCGEPSGAHVTACAHSCGLMSHSARSLFAAHVAFFSFWMAARARAARAHRPAASPCWSMRCTPTSPSPRPSLPATDAHRTWFGALHRAMAVLFAGDGGAALHTRAVNGLLACSAGRAGRWRQMMCPTCRGLP
jgi:hypothetical protein